MSDPVAHARSYPFPIPDHSFVYDNGAVHRLEAAPPERRGRTPVLAAGSNQSPEQSGRKYAEFPSGPGVRIPAERGVLADFWRPELDEYRTWSVSDDMWKEWSGAVQNSDGRYSDAFARDQRLPGS